MNNDLISRSALKFEIGQQLAYHKEKAKLTTINADKMSHSLVATGIQLAIDIIDNAQTVEYPFYAEAYQTGYEEGKNERPQGKWNTHQVACILAELFGDTCACNYCGIDEWLPKKCDFANKECPDVVGVACWEQFLKHRSKMKGEEE